jgi:hypothetical protein
MRSDNGDLGSRKARRFAVNPAKARHYARRRQERFARHMVAAPPAIHPPGEPSMPHQQASNAVLPFPRGEDAEAPGARVSVSNDPGRAEARITLTGDGSRLDIHVTLTRRPPDGDDGPAADAFATEWSSPAPVGRQAG